MIFQHSASRRVSLLYLKPNFSLTREHISIEGNDAQNFFLGLFCRV